MGRRTEVCIALLTVVILLTASTSCMAFKVLPASLHLEQSAARIETYEILLLNDTDQPETLDVHVGEWLRNPDGSYDWSIPAHGARWIHPEQVPAGTTLQIRYRIAAQDLDDVDVVDFFEAQGWQGTLTSDRPQPLAGPGTQPLIGSSGSSTPFPITATRTIAVPESGSSGDVLVTLDVTCHQDCTSLIVYEVFSRSVDVTADPLNGWQFATVNQSNIDWISLTESSLTLAPGEQRSLELVISTPEDASGTTWSALFIQAEPSVSTVEGAQLVSIYRTAIKVFVTIPGTQNPSGQVAAVAIDAKDSQPPSVSFEFANTGNTLLTAIGNVTIVDVEGNVVREAILDSIQILPGSHRATSIDLPDPPLPPGIYQAIVSVDFGSAELAGGVRTFRIR